LEVRQIWRRAEDASNERGVTFISKLIIGIAGIRFTLATKEANKVDVLKNVPDLVQDVQWEVDSIWIPCQVLVIDVFLSNRRGIATDPFATLRTAEFLNAGNLKIFLKKSRETSLVAFKSAKFRWGHILSVIWEYKNSSGNE